MPAPLAAPLAALALALAALAGCASYEPAPIDPSAVLARLEAVEWSAPTTDEAAPGDVPRVAARDLAAFAVTTNPQLAALRAELGVQSALLVEAGLLPDPQLGWGAMELLASQLMDDTSTTVDALAGLSLMFPLLRPGERDARTGAAGWRLEEARQQVVAAEWTLTRDIHLACEELRAAERLLEQTRALTAIADSTSDHFAQARDAGAATAIEANLALGELQDLRLGGLRAEARARQARQALAALLGLPPDASFALLDDTDPVAHAALRATPDELVAHAVASRPDLTALLARYQAAEDELRLAVAQQFPALSIGTGFSLTLPIFSDFNAPQIRTAAARREQLRREYTAAVHAARRQVHDAHVLWELAVRELALVEDELLPNAERNLELSRVALEAGEGTLFEMLALQGALVAARTRHTEARAGRAMRAWTLLAASGWLLGAAGVGVPAGPDGLGRSDDSARSRGSDPEEPE